MAETAVAEGVGPVGDVVPFQPRGAKPAEAALRLVGSQYQRELQAREHLPRVLAACVRHGLHDLVLRTVVAWGEGALSAAELIDMCLTEAAVCGVRDLGIEQE